MAAAIYDPELHPADVISELEVMEHMLREAQQHEIRFRFERDA